MNIQQLIIDTDTGVDDAIALMMVLDQAKALVAGVTTVNGNVGVDKSTRNVSIILEKMGAPIQVYRGAALPLMGKSFNVSDLMGDDGFGNVAERYPVVSSTVQQESAACALVRLARQHRGNCTIVALGPLTNLAMAIHLDPEFPHYVSRLVLMGGTLEAKGNTSPVAEFNFYVDPEAASFVLRAGFADVQIIPWETSIKAMMLWQDYESLLKIETPRAAFFADFTAFIVRVLQERMAVPGIPLPDPLTMAVALNPDCVLQSRLAYVDVDYSNGSCRGMMVIDWHGVMGKKPNANIIADVDNRSMVTMIRSSLDAKQR